MPSTIRMDSLAWPAMKENVLSLARLPAPPHAPCSTPIAEASDASSTERSGSSQKAHTPAPVTSRAAATIKGACQLPYWTRKPNTSGESAPPILPAMFIMPETVPEYLPPASIGTAQEGPIVHSRKNIDAVRQ